MSSNSLQVQTILLITTNSLANAKILFVAVAWALVPHGCSPRALRHKQLCQETDVITRKSSGKNYFVAVSTSTISFPGSLLKFAIFSAGHIYS